MSCGCPTACVTCVFCETPTATQRQFTPGNLRGRCVVCDKPFCVVHSGCDHLYDDLCMSCVDTINERHVLHNEQVFIRANWWWNNVPILGLFMYGLILACKQKPLIVVDERK